MVDIEITGQHIDIGDALRTHVTDSLSAGIEKYFSQGGEARVAFGHEGSGYACDVTVHLASGILLKSAHRAPEIYASFDGAVDRMEKRLRRYKRRLKDHTHTQKPDIPALAVADYVIQPEHDDHLEDDAQGAVEQPVIIAETRSELPPLTVSQAVMRMELADAPALVFRNAAHGGMNVVYRRPDGAIGWIDPPSKD